MRRHPTEQQAHKLMVLAGWCIVIVPKRREWMPLLRRGWVEPSDPRKDDDGPYLPPLRITPDGLRALADATDAGVLQRPTLKEAVDERA